MEELHRTCSKKSDPKDIALFTFFAKQNLNLNDIYFLVIQIAENRKYVKT
jgi:hypothetical protein